MTYQPPTALPRDFIDQEDVHRALVAHDFGTVFRLARERAGISYSRIATECDIKPNRVGELAKGIGRITTFEKIVQIADALRVPGHVLGLAARPWESDSPGHTSEETGHPHVRRRTILQAATSTGLAAALPALHRPEPPRRITPAYVEQLRARAARLRRLDIVLGGGDTHRVYLAEVQHTKSLLRDAVFSGGSRQKLTGLLAEQAQQAGWAAFDGGRAREARSLYEESRSHARDAHDDDLYGNALAFLAYQELSDDRKPPSPSREPRAPRSRPPPRPPSARCSTSVSHGPAPSTARHPTPSAHWTPPATPWTPPRKTSRNRTGHPGSTPPSWRS